LRKSAVRDPFWQSSGQKTGLYQTAAFHADSLKKILAEFNGHAID
jgi:hypothetical protein